jgi:hypothetical protein
VLEAKKSQAKLQEKNIIVEQLYLSDMPETIYKQSSYNGNNFT